MHDDKSPDECAIVGVYGHPEAANLTYLGLCALQHRGQESTGIVASDERHIHAEVGMGRVNDFFTEERLAQLPGHLAIGHNRYSTTGSSVLRNAQPLLVDYVRGSLAVAHNGNLVNAQRLRAELEAHGSIFRSTTDTEVIPGRRGAVRIVSRWAMQVARQRQRSYHTIRRGQGTGGRLDHSKPLAIDFLGRTRVRSILTKRPPCGAVLLYYSWSESRQSPQPLRAAFVSRRAPGRVHSEIADCVAGR